MCGLGSGGPLQRGQKNLDDLGEEPQHGTLEMCAPGTALLAEGTHFRAPINCSCVRVQPPV